MPAFVKFSEGNDCDCFDSAVYCVICDSSKDVVKHKDMLKSGITTEFNFLDGDIIFSLSEKEFLNHVVLESI